MYIHMGHCRFGSLFDFKLEKTVVGLKSAITISLCASCSEHNYHYVEIPDSFGAYFSQKGGSYLLLDKHFLSNDLREWT